VLFQPGNWIQFFYDYNILQGLQFKPPQKKEGEKKKKKVIY